MKNLLILSLVVLISGCERARMKTAGERPDFRSNSQQNFSGPRDPGPTVRSSNSAQTESTEATAPASASAPAPAPAVAPIEDQTLQTEGIKNLRIYDANESSSIATCQLKECLQPVAFDGGRIHTEQDLRFEPRTHLLDIVFVFDTSASMRDEHHAVAREVTKFISQLSHDVSYRIGVLLAHGPRSGAGVRVGQLYSETGTNLVIKADDYGSAKSEQERQAIARRVSQSLIKRLDKLPTDRSEAQGEAGMLNLYTAFANPDRLHDLKQAGLLRDKTALLIITIADENDVCFDYEEASRQLGQPVVGTYDTERDRRSEQAAFEAGDTCRAVVRGQRLTANHVVRAVKSARGDLPVIFTGIHYLEDKVPVRDDKFSRDNEPGRGYLQVISAGNGIAIDLAAEDFANSLTKIGDYSNFHMKYENTFYIPGQVDMAKFDPSSVRVRFRNELQDTLVPAEHVRVRINQAQQRVEVIIDYEELKEAYEQKRIREGSKLLIDYAHKEVDQRRR